VADGHWRFIPWAFLAVVVVALVLQSWRGASESRDLGRRLARLESTVTSLERARSRTDDWMAAFFRDLEALRERLRRFEAEQQRLGEPGTPGSEAGGKELAAAFVSQEQEIQELRRRLQDLERLSRNLSAAQAFGDTGAILQAMEAQEQSSPPQTQQGSNPGAIHWSPEQVLGEPDTMADGDRPTAWASRSPDAGPEWIEVDFADAVEPGGILVRETYNPGAVVRIEAVDGSGRYHTIWEGEDPTRESPGDFVVTPRQRFATQRVRVHLDSAKVQGWNEIDAIGLMAGGRTQWAEAASASSTYASGYGPEVVQDPSAGASE
jgi:hypothetical protein